MLFLGGVKLALCYRRVGVNQAADFRHEFRRAERLGQKHFNANIS
jgi:hypothetical protein